MRTLIYFVVILFMIFFCFSNCEADDASSDYNKWTQHTYTDPLTNKVYYQIKIAQKNDKTNSNTYIPEASLVFEYDSYENTSQYYVETHCANGIFYDIKFRFNNINQVFDSRALCIRNNNTERLDFIKHLHGEEGWNSTIKYFDKSFIFSSEGYTHIFEWDRSDFAKSVEFIASKVKKDDKKPVEIKKEKPEKISFPIYTLTEKEYNEFITNNEKFRDADKKLRDLWNKLMSIANDDASKKKFMKDQLEWIKSGRNLYMSAFMYDGLDKVTALTRATKRREHELRAVYENTMVLIDAKKNHNEYPRFREDMYFMDDDDFPKCMPE